MRSISSLGGVSGETVTEPKPVRSGCGGAASTCGRPGRGDGCGSAAAWAPADGSSPLRPESARICSCRCSSWAASARICVSMLSRRPASAAPIAAADPEACRPPAGAAGAVVPRASNSSVPITTCISTSCSSSCSMRWRRAPSPAGAASRAGPGAAFGAGAAAGRPWGGGCCWAKASGPMAIASTAAVPRRGQKRSGIEVMGPFSRFPVAGRPARCVEQRQRSVLFNTTLERPQGVAATTPLN